MLAAYDQRRKKPSYTIPFFFEALELVMIWMVFSIAEASMNVTQWNTITYALAFAWLVYTLHKLKKVLIRQSIHKW